jgi:hypothetical protein
MVEPDCIKHPDGGMFWRLENMWSTHQDRQDAVCSISSMLMSACRNISVPFPVHPGISGSQNLLDQYRSGRTSRCRSRHSHSELLISHAGWSMETGTSSFQTGRLHPQLHALERQVLCEGLHSAWHHPDGNTDKRCVAIVDTSRGTLVVEHPL